MTTIELTTAEATAWRDVPEGGTFLLVRDGECICLNGLLPATEETGSVVSGGGPGGTNLYVAVSGGPGYWLSTTTGPHDTIVGWAYAVGQPLPIYHESNEDYDELDPCLLVTASGRIFYWNPPLGDSTDITAALAHYGPPESLVGKWAVELRRA